MRGFVVYESMFGNTAEIAGAIADGVKEHLDVELHGVEEGLDRNHGSAGDGVRPRLPMSRTSSRESDAQRGQGGSKMACGGWTTCPQVSEPHAAFDTRVEMVRRLPGSAAKAAAKVARKLGYRQITRPESFYVVDVSGPLLDGEVQRARVWGAQLAQSLTGEPRDWG
jgi:hypothetical protein